jgi:hypothetical protein
MQRIRFYRSSIAPANSDTPYGCINNLRSTSKALIECASLARIRPIDLLRYEPDHSCDAPPRPDCRRRDRLPLNPKSKTARRSGPFLSPSLKYLPA